MLLEIIKMSFNTLKSNVFRTFLTVLGVVIGIASIIGLTALTEGAQDTMMKELANLGGDTLYVGITTDSSKSYFNETDIESLQEIEGVTGIMPSTSGYYSVSGTFGIEDFVTTTGVNELYFERNENIIEGRALNYYDVLYKTNTVVLGEDLAESLFANMSPIGESVKIKGVDFIVVGVAETTNGLSFVTGSNCCYVPYTHIESTFLSGGITSLEIYYDTDIRDFDSVEAEVEQTLYYMLNSNEDAYSTFSMESILEMVALVQDTMSLLMIGIASISLIVGGIGIMNMMLTSVTERTNEIGLKKALGAQKPVILLQFIIEAVIISTIGGILGVGLGYAFSGVCAALMDFTPIITGGAVGIAVAFSAAVGLVFGIMPARKAANLKPIDALRAL
ncbi:MAG: ABC transporter permease [Bacillota bacterium]